MNKVDVTRLFSNIALYYPNFEVGKEKVEAWHEVLEPYSLEEVKQRLKAHVKTEKFPPTVAELIPRRETTLDFEDMDDFYSKYGGGANA